MCRPTGEFMNNRTKSIKNLLYSTFGQIITIIFGLLLPRLWVVNYGSEVNGLLTSLGQFLVYLSLFEAGIGAATLQALYKPLSEDNWHSINGILSATHLYYKKAGLWYFLGLIALSLIYPLIANSTLPYFLIAGTVFLSGIGNVTTFWFHGKYTFLLRAEGKSYILTNLVTIITVLNSIAKIVLIKLNVNILVILSATFIIQSIQLCYIMWYMRRYKKLDLHTAPDYASISQKNSTLGHQISSLIFSNTDVLILTLFFDLRVVSVYSMFKMIVTHLESILDIPFNSVSFALGQLFFSDRKKFIRQIDIAESLNSAAYYAVFSVAYFLFVPFMRLYTKGVTDINYADPVLALLFVLTTLLNKSRAPMLNTISYAGHFKATLPASILESAINIATSLIGVHFLGIYGVLLGTVAALLYRTNDIILYTNRKILNRSALKTYTVYLIDIVVFVLLQFVFRILFDSLWINSYLRFFIAGVICTGISVAAAFGAQILFFPDCRSTVHQFLRSMLRKLRRS